MAFNMNIPISSAIFLATFSSVILTIRGDDVPIGACAIKNDENYLRPDLKSILPKEVDDVNLNFAFNLDFTGNLVVSKTSPDGLADVRKESGLDTYSFFLTEEFKDFDSKTGKLDSNVTDLKGGTFSFICDEDDTTALIDMVYSQNVRDTNNNPPTFNQPSYEILVPMPLLPKYDITALLDGGIIATDLDFSEQMVTFTIDDPRFALETKSDPTSKDYTAVLKTIQPFSLTEDSTFTITATDSGNPPRPATASLTIKVDAKNSVGVLSFSSALFTMTYSEDDGKPTLGGLDPSPIHITTPNPEGTKVIISAGNEGGEFDANFDTSTSEVTVTVGKALTSDLGVVTLKLSASSEATTVEAVININLPVDAGPATPKFSQAYYEASYQVDPDNKAVVTVTGEGIKLTDGADGAVVTLSGDQSDKFVITKNDGDDVWTITVNGLPDEVLQKGGELILQLIAKSSDGNSEGWSTVIISLPSVPVTIPRFKESFYRGTYKIDENDETKATVLLDHNIENSLSDDASFKIEFSKSEFSDNFQLMETDVGSKIYTIAVATALASDILQNNKEIVLSVDASIDSTTEHGSAAVIIELPSVSEDVFKFSEASYTANYKKDHTITVDKAISIDSSADQTDVKVEVVGDFVQNFVISKNPDNAEYTLSVAADHPLDESTLLKNDKIVVVLQATLKDVSTLATVIVTLPPKSPEFEKTLYLAKYTVTSDTTATVDFDAGSELKLQGENNGKDIQTTGTYAENFKLDYDTATESYKVTVQKVLDPPVLTDNSEIFITIQTSLPEAVKANEAQILLKLPAPTKDILPKLDKRYYTGSYIVNDDGTHTLTVDDIKVVSEEAETTVVEVEGDFGSNFNCKVKDASDPTTWTLEISNHLDQALIDEHKDLLVVLKATLPGSIGEASASVLISLPEGGTITKNLKFTENFYSAKYELNENKPSLNVDNLISVAAPDASTATVEFKDGPKKNFIVEKSKDGDNWVVSVDEPLDDEQLKQNPLVLELVARQANSIDGGATLVIQVPTPEGAGTITFKEPFYQATYKNDGDKPEIVVTGQITLTDHNAVVSVTSEYDVFALTCDGEGKCTLTTTGLPDDVLQTKKEIMLIIEAAVSSDSAIKGKSTVILDLPLKTDEKVPKFTNAIYEANYTESNGKGEIASPEIKLDPQELADNISEMTVDDDNFQLNANADGTSWVLQLKDGTQTLPTGDKNVILLKLTVKLKDTPNEGTSSIIVNLPLKTDEKVPKFTSDIYETEYTEYNGKGQLASLEIKLATQESPDNILGITVDDDVNFQLKANDDGISWVLQLKDGIEKLPTEDKNVILLKLTVKLNDTEKEGTSAVIVKLPKKYAATAIEFSSTVYHGKYVEGNPTGSVDITEEIKVVPNDDVDLTKVTVDLQGENKDNFDRTFDQTTGLISLTLKSLPDGALDLSILQVDISAKLDVDKSAVISTVVIELPANNQVNPDAPTSDDTGLVAGIAVLAVLLVGFIVGTGVIYFIKRKRSQTYNDLDDFRYEKNAKANDSISRVDPPKRRPTGVIRYELDNETEGPADTDVDAPIEPNNNAERRKSVVFDENVETLPIESRDERVSDEEENAEDEDGDDASEKSDRNDDSDQEKDVDTST